MDGRTTRRRFLALATGTAATAGCASKEPATETTTGTPTAATDTEDATNPVLGDVTQRGDLRLTSPAFEDGGAIPRKYGHGEANVNPPLAVEGADAEAAASLTLVVDDPDAVEPAGKVWLHWLVWNVPPTRTEIPEDWDAADAEEGKNDFGERGYGGPDPPDGEHRYRFKLYAVDRTLDLPGSATERDVGEAMRGAVVAQTQLIGTYAP